MGYNLNYIYNDLTATEPWNRGLFERNHPKMAELFQVSELLSFAEIYDLDKCG